MIKKDNKVLNVPPLRFKKFTKKLKQLKLKDVSESIGGGTPPTSNKEFWNGTIPWISSSDVSINSISYINPTRFITDEAIKKSSTKLCPKDTIHVVTRVGLGKIIYTDYPLCTSQDFTNLISIKEEPKFLTYLLSKKLSSISSQGSTIKGITTDELMALDIMIPEKGEQNKIANLLSVIDKQIEVQRKLIENYESLSKSIYNLILHRYETTRITLKSLISKRIISPIKPSDLKKFDNERIYLSTSSINGTQIVSDEGMITFLKRPSRASLIPLENSVWFAKMKNSIKVFLAKKDDEEKYILSTGYYGFKTNNILISQWLKFVFLSDEFNRQKDQFSEGSSMSGIKDNQLNDIYIQMIDNSQDLESSLTFLLNMESNIDCSKNILREFNALKTFLLENLFV